MREEGYLGQKSGKEQEVDHEGHENVIDLFGHVFHSSFLVMNEVVFIFLLGFKLRHNNVVGSSVYSKVGICVYSGLSILFSRIRLLVHLYEGIFYSEN